MPKRRWKWLIYFPNLTVTYNSFGRVAILQIASQPKSSLHGLELCLVEVARVKLSCNCFTRTISIQIAGWPMTMTLCPIA